jgi:PAS domain S-box-containing protein
MLLDRFKKRIDGETIPSRYSFRLYRKEGEVWWAELSAVAIIWDGRPATLNFIIDITERKLAENALRESEERYRIVTQSITDIVWDWDISAGSLQWFGDIDTLLGYAPGAFPRTIEAWEGIIHADDRDRVIHALDRSRHTGEPFDEEYRVLTRDGTDRYWCDRAHAIHDDRGTVVRIIGAITDATERRKTEERLRESDERYRQFFRTTLDSVFITSPEGRYIDFNDRLMERLGCKSREEAFGIDIASTYAHPEERAGFIALVERDGYIKERPIQFRKRDGTILNTLITIVPMKNPDGSVKAFIGTIRDATEREQAEKVLRQSEAKFHSLYEHMIEGAALHELTYNDQGVPVDYVFIQTNPAFGRQLGISEDNVIGKTSREVYGVAEPPYLDIYARVALTGEPEVFETWFPSLAKHFSISAYRPYKGSFATIFEDITERKRAEEALRGSEAQLRTLIDTLPDLVWLKDPEGIYLSCNRRFGNFFGAAERDIVGKTDYDFMEKDQGDFFRHHDKAALAAGGPTANEEEITFANDGHREVLETIKTPVRASDGRLIGVLGISRNITGRKQADEALRQANRKLTLLSGITRHDINNQLTVLKGYLTLVENMQPDTLSGEYFRKINAAVQRISAMIQFMKDYEKIGVTAPEWQDTHALVDAVVKQTSLGQITVKNDLPSGTEVFADPLIAKVIYNLTDNAVRHGGKIMTIRFFVKENNENRILVCEDDGEGIPAGEKEKIFERGFGKNSGLGLALSREILSITGITIVETGVPGKGARFEMAVPGGCYRQGGGKNH